MKYGRCFCPDSDSKKFQIIYKKLKSVDNLNFNILSRLNLAIQEAIAMLRSNNKILFQHRSRVSLNISNSGHPHLHSVSRGFSINFNQETFA